MTRGLRLTFDDHDAIGRGCVPSYVTPPTSPPPKPDDARRSVLPAGLREVAYADAKYVLEWLRQSKAPENIVQLQERATAYLGVASGR